MRGIKAIPWAIIAVFTVSIVINLMNMDYFQPKNSVEITGTIDDQCRPVEELHRVNSEINPILNELKKSKFFRIFKVNLESKCPFWDAEGSCISNK